MMWNAWDPLIFGLKLCVLKTVKTNEKIRRFDFGTTHKGAKILKN